MCYRYLYDVVYEVKAYEWLDGGIFAQSRELLQRHTAAQGVPYGKHCACLDLFICWCRKYRFFFIFLRKQIKRNYYDSNATKCSVTP